MNKDTSGNKHTGSTAPRKAKRGGGGAKKSSTNMQPTKRAACLQH